MNILKVIAIGVCLQPFGLTAQDSEIESILNEIEKNNIELKAMAQFIETEQVKLSSGNNLPDPIAGAYYLPFGNHSSGAYTEIQISQSFEFPTVYSARKRLNENQLLTNELHYALKRQDLLNTARKYCLELIVANKRLVHEQEWADNASAVYTQIEELYLKNQVGLLNLNKAKVAWIQGKFKIQQLKKDKSQLLLVLKSLNNGNVIALNASEWIPSIDLMNKDSLWTNKTLKDPWLNQLEQEKEIAKQQLRLSKNNSLPQITAGYNYQGIKGDTYSGIYAGLTIPLWSNRNNVKAAKSNVVFKETATHYKKQSAYLGFEKQYNDYQLLQLEFNEYKLALEGMNSEELLLKAYELGEISFIEYHMELRFYHDAIDTMLNYQAELYAIQSDLLKHNL